MSPKEVKLRRISISDAADICRWMNDPETVKYLGYGFIKPRKIEDIRQEIIMELDGDFTSKRYSVTDENGEYLGEAGLILPDARAGVCEITIVLTAKARGSQIAYRALNELIKTAFDDLGFNRLHARVMGKNEKAVKLFERLGFTKEGVLRRHMMTGDGLDDVILFGLLKDEFTAANAD